jgi:hypothetical protein
VIVAVTGFEEGWGVALRDAGHQCETPAIRGRRAILAATLADKALSEIGERRLGRALRQSRSARLRGHGSEKAGVGSTRRIPAFASGERSLDKSALDLNLG